MFRKCANAAGDKHLFKHLFLFSFLSFQLELYKVMNALTSGAREHLKSSDELRAKNIA